MKCWHEPGPGHQHNSWSNESAMWEKAGPPILETLLSACFLYLDFWSLTCVTCCDCSSRGRSRYTFRILSCGVLGCFVCVGARVGLQIISIFRYCFLNSRLSITVAAVSDLYEFRSGFLFHLFTETKEPTCQVGQGQVIALCRSQQTLNTLSSHWLLHMCTRAPVALWTKC